MHIKPPQKKLSTNPNDYVLPPMDLPKYWTYGIDESGRVYYYHLKIRIPQWVPPIKLLPLGCDGADGAPLGAGRDAGNESSDTDVDDVDAELLRKVQALEASIAAKRKNLGKSGIC